MTQLLLERGATINTFDKKDRRAVHWAAYMGHVDIVRLLVSFGAELGCRDKQVHVCCVSFCAFLLIFHASLKKQCHTLHLANFLDSSVLSFQNLRLRLKSYRKFTLSGTWSVDTISHHKVIVILSHTSSLTNIFAIVERLSITACCIYCCIAVLHIYL